MGSVYTGFQALPVRPKFRNGSMKSLQEHCCSAIAMSYERKVVLEIAEYMTITSGGRGIKQ